MRMPGMDGPALYEEIARIRPDLTARVVFVTGDTMSASARAFLDASGCACLEKPIDPDELRELVRSL